MTTDPDIHPPIPPDAVERDGDGFVIPAELVGAVFGLLPAEVPEMMRSGKITSRCETGVDADAGTWRLTVYHDGRALRLTVDTTGRILSRATFAAPRPATRTASGPRG